MPEKFNSAFSTTTQSKSVIVKHKKAFAGGNDLYLSPLRLLRIFSILKQWKVQCHASKVEGIPWVDKGCKLDLRKRRLYRSALMLKHSTGDAIPQHYLALLLLTSPLPNPENYFPRVKNIWVLTGKTPEPRVSHCILQQMPFWGFWLIHWVGKLPGVSCFLLPLNQSHIQPWAFCFPQLKSEIMSANSLANNTPLLYISILQYQTSAQV